jgi:hypothetical protein
MPERAHLAERLEREGTARVAAQSRRDVLRRTASLAHSVLRGGRARLPCARVHDEGAIAYRPHARTSRHLEIRLRHDAAAILRAVERGHHGVGAAWHRAHQCAGLDTAAIVHEGSLGSSAGQSRVEPELYPALHEQALGELREVPGQFRQDEAARVEEHDPDLRGTDVAKAPRRRAHEVVELGDRLHSGEPTPRHHEGKEPAPCLCIPLDVGLLESMDGVVAQGEGIAQVLEGQRVLAEPGLASKAGDVARAITRWSYGSWSWREPTPAARVTRWRFRSISSMARV